MIPAGKSLALALVATALAAAVLAWQVAAVWPFVSDDAFIALRYAERLVNGQGLTWEDGERVEGYSNLLWVLLLAAELALGVPPVAALRLPGGACALASLWLLAWFARPQNRRDLGACFAAPLLLATAAPMVVWTLGGLEGPLVILLLLLGLTALRGDRLANAGPRHLVRASLPFALGCWTRSEAPLLLACVALVLVLARLRTGLRTALTAAALFLLLPVVAVFVQLLFRLGYYGEWLPNTAHAKLMLTPLALTAGYRTVLGATFVLSGQMLAAGIGLVALLARGQRAWAFALASTVLAQFLFICITGGDHFAGWRTTMPALAGLSLLGTAALRILAARGGLATLCGYVLCAAAPLLSLVISRSDTATQRARNEDFEWQGMVIAQTLARHFGDARPLLAVDGAGAMPFFSRLPALDMLGLNDKVIARTRPSPYLDRFVPGHMHANGAYVLSRRPDIVQFGGPPGLLHPLFESDRQLEESAEFLADYRCVSLELFNQFAGAPMRCLLWLRLDGKVGARSGSDAIEVPGHLLHSLRQTQPLGIHSPHEVALEDPRVPQLLAMYQWLRSVHRVVSTPTGLVLELRDGSPATLVDLPVPAGKWRVVHRPAEAPIASQLLAAEGALPQEDGLFVWRGGPLTLETRRTDGLEGPLRVAQVTLHRQP